MKFDAVERKKQAEQEKSKKVKKEIDRLTKIYPVEGITKQDFVKLRVQGETIYCAYFDTKKYDLLLLGEQEADDVTSSYWKFLREYSLSVKELFMNFPEDNQRQQAYVKYKRDHAKELHQMRILQTELEKLKFIEKNYKKLASYLCIYGETEAQLEQNINVFYKYKDLFHPKQMKRKTVEKILRLLNNTGGIEIYDSETKTSG